MSLAIVYSRASSGIQAPLVTVETHLSNGIVGFHIVGLPETAVKESRDRVRSALMNAHFEFPTRHITVNLAPADLPKEGGRFDLPIALGILAASQQIPAEGLKEYEFTGELALSGELRPIRGMLPVVLAAYKADRNLIVPYLNGHEAALIPDAKVFSAHHLLDVCAHLKGEKQLEVPHREGMSETQCTLDLLDVKGQFNAKRALEIAAAGAHSLLYIGPPGTGKTMLASRLPSILPSLNEKEALEVAAIASMSRSGFNSKQWKMRPFRSPHHSSSSVALVGGGRPPCPGEISLAHHGVLFLDELPEFSRHVLDALREPLESGFVTISRAAFQTTFPAKFQLIAAMNPCPCGYAGNRINCQCSAEQIKRYLTKISGPLLDRIDMQVEVAKLSHETLASKNLAGHLETSKVVQQRVSKALELQMARQGKLNAALSVTEIEHFCSLDQESQQLLRDAMTKFNLSARSYHRIIKVARTITDLQEKEVIHAGNVAESLNFRSLDRIKKVF
jgi:magnesium chelatase family protein